MLTRVLDPEGALTFYKKAIGLKPDYSEAYRCYATALVKLKRYEEALANYSRCIELEPEQPYLSGTLLNAKMHLCDWRNWGSDYKTILQDIAQGRRSALPFDLLTIPSTALQQKRCAAIFMENMFPAADRHWQCVRYTHDRLRIGYFCGEFYNHATMRLAAGLFEQHDRSRFEIVALSLGRTPQDEMRTRLVNAFDQFHDVWRDSDEAVTKLARMLEIDIAVDLDGLANNTRPGIFARRLAPLQVNWLAYPVTMGAQFIDYLIADQTLIPEAHRDAYTEKIVYLPNSYQVNDSKRQISEYTPSRAELGLPEQGLVFCNFNSNYKITPDIFHIWMRLLHQVDGSVLWLLEDNPGAAKNLLCEAKQLGISGERLVFAPRINLADHLARHRQADLFLDTFYCNAHTTASDALWAGLPVLTCLGETFAGRVAASLLNAIGLPELITQSPQEYEALALMLATHPTRLSEIKQRLADNRLTHPLFDTARFTRDLEAAYVAMWERYQRGEAPEHIFVHR